ncbi:hypothetical protein LXL04_017194 [Taraxacum kok-saghyz]
MPVESPVDASGVATRKSVNAYMARPRRYCKFTRMLHPKHVGSLLTAYGSMIGFLQLRSESVFETHSVFMNMSVVAITIFVLAYMMLVSIGEESNTNQLSVNHKIVISIAVISVILAFLTLFFTIILRPKLMWIGLTVMGLIVIVITAYACIKHLKSIGKQILKAISKLVDYIKSKF